MKKTLLISVTYTDNTDEFWCDSNIKNKHVIFDTDKDNIHSIIKELCSDIDGMELVYNGKPQGNVFSEKFNEVERIGYIYRGKYEIYDRDMIKPQIGRFDVWVTITETIPFEIEEIY